MKICTKCGVEKPRDDFQKMARHSTGLQSKCKACAQAYYLVNRQRMLARDLAYRQNNQEKLNERKRAYREKNPDRIRAINAKYHAANREKLRLKQAAYFASNTESVLRGAAAWKVANRDKVNSAKARRRAMQLLATPAWANPESMREFYIAADFLSMVTGEWYEVDHIVPLQSKAVCGLHVHANLQVITGRENQSKGNRHWPDMP